jgi:hypothetical protein
VCERFIGGYAHDEECERNIVGYGQGLMYERIIVGYGHVRGLQLYRE